jgi:formiminotetrahydrofolate cyclodeaminase
VLVLFILSTAALNKPYNSEEDHKSRLECIQKSKEGHDVAFAFAQRAPHALALPVTIQQRQQEKEEKKTQG